MRPAPLVLLSFSSSDLALAAAAWRRERHQLPDLRLANLSRLGHPLSVDLYLEKVVAGSKLVILRLNGGAGYWRYGLERLAETCRRRKVMLAALPGEDAADAALDAAGTLPLPVARRLWLYFREGGIDNAAHMLAFAASLAGHEASWREAETLPRFGRYTGWSGPVAVDAPPVALVFYRSHLQAGDVEDVRRFQVAQHEAGMHAPAMNSDVSALRFFFTMKRDGPNLSRKLIRVPYPRKLPLVLSPEEVARLLAATTCLKHRAALSVAYGAGPRLAEGYGWRQTFCCARMVKGTDPSLPVSRVFSVT